MKLAEFIKIVDGENAYFSSRLDSIINESMPASHADERVNDFLSDLFFAAYNKLVLPVKLKSIYCVVSTIFMLAVSYMLSAFFCIDPIVEFLLWFATAALSTYAAFQTFRLFKIQSHLQSIGNELDGVSVAVLNEFEFKSF